MAFQTDAPVTTSPAVVDNTVYIVSESAYALDASNGTLNWQFKSDWGSLHTSPAVVGSTVYVGNTNGDVYALDTNTGSVECLNAQSEGTDDKLGRCSALPFVGLYNLHGGPVGFCISAV